MNMRTKVIGAASGGVLLAVAALLLIQAFGGSDLNRLFARDFGKIGASSAPVAPTESSAALNSAMTDVADATLPTVVSIAVVVEQTAMSDPMREEFREFFRFFGEVPDPDEPRRSEGAGSGVFISEDGYIVTNNHVVEDAAEITVITHDRKEYDAELVGSDPLTDLAVIKIDAKGMKPAHFGDIENVKVGSMAFAVGNPLGLSSTITNGIVSAVGRGNLFLLRDRSGYSVEYFIQTDAAINPGNSGGGLFDINGSLIGINTAIATGTGNYIGYGFAVPVDLVKSVVLDLLEDGKVDRGYIGVRIRTVDEAIAKASGLDNVRGAMVNDVLPDSPAEKVGVKAGDIILEFDGKKVNSSNELQSLVVLHRAGDKVELKLWRDGKEITKTAELKKRDGDEDDTAVAGESIEEEPADDEPFEFQDLGFTVEPPTSELKKSLDVEYGVFVSSVERYGEASKRGLFRGGVIQKAGREEIRSISDLKKVLNSKKSGDAVLLHVRYEDSNRIVALEIP